MWSYLLNSIFTHKSCRYILEGVLARLCHRSRRLLPCPIPNIIMFSERNSEGTGRSLPLTFYYVPQDDYDTWPGEAALSAMGQWFTRPNEGWIKYNRHQGGSNYIYYDGHAKWMRWGQARLDQFP